MRAHKHQLHRRNWKIIPFILCTQMLVAVRAEARAHIIICDDPFDELPQRNFGILFKDSCWRQRTTNKRFVECKESARKRIDWVSEINLKLWIQFKADKCMFWVRISNCHVFILYCFLFFFLSQVPICAKCWRMIHNWTIMESHTFEGVFLNGISYEGLSVCFFNLKHFKGHWLNAAFFRSFPSIDCGKFTLGFYFE